MTDKKTTHDDENTFAKEALQCDIGLKLQQAREEKGLSLEHIVKELKLSMTFLQALESGNWDKMPGKVYTLGFLRQYAALLNVDITAETERVKSDTYELTTPLTYPDAPISPNRIWAIGAALVFILIIIVINLADDSDNSQKHIALHEEATQVQLEEKSIELNNSSKPLTPVETPTSETVNNESSPVAKSSMEENAPVEVVKQKSTYSFYAATDDVWLQVYEKVEDSEPALLREVLLKKGQSFSIVNTSAKLLLTAGNSRSLEILVNGKVLFAVDTLGQQGKVLRRFLINP